ncbi:MAG: transglutaminase domain-containing protein [Bacteroidota bacterium]
MLKRQFNKVSLYLYIILFIFSIYPIIFSTVSNISSTRNKKELFNIQLSRFKSVNDIIAYIDGIYSAKCPEKEIDTVSYVSVTSDVIKKRFFHGLSAYSFKDNWIAYTTSKLLWSHLSAIVDPDDILDHSEGLCSQQTIVFLEILKRKGIQTRWVGLGYKEGPGHFLAEVFYNGSWHIYDVNLEPKWEKIVNHHKSIDYYRVNPDSLYRTYEGILDKTTFYKIMEEVKYGYVNEFPAKKMLLVHRTTKILTFLLPLFFLIMIIVTLNKKEIPSKIFKKTPFKFRKAKSDAIEN